jgi:DNA primase
MQIADKNGQQYYLQTFRDKLYAFARKSRPAFTPGQKGKKGPAALTVPLRPPAADDGKVQERVLLAAIVNHPEIFNEIEDELGHMDLIDAGHDALRQAVMSALSEDGLDAEALRNHLEGQGFGGVLSGLLSPAVYTHAGFAKPGAEPQKVLEGWRETCKFLQQKTTWKEIRQAGEELARDFSDEKERRIIALRNMNKTSEG